jgi:hypothetical protein
MAKTRTPRDLGRRASRFRSLAMPPRDPIAAIARAVQILAETGDSTAALIAEGLAQWSRSRTISFEEALGYAPGIRGATMQRTRDTALGELVRLFPGLSGRPLERKVREAVEEYETTRWAADDAARHRPDSVDGLCFDLLSSGGLPCADHLRALLAAVGD